MARVIKCWRRITNQLPARMLVTDARESRDSPSYADVRSVTVRFKGKTCYLVGNIPYAGDSGTTVHTRLR
jgi:hypothetical protein